MTSVEEMLSQPSEHDVDQRIRQLVMLPRLCPWCLQEQGQPWPEQATTSVCEHHLARLRAGH
jgi:hypothetical protein